MKTSAVFKHTIIVIVGVFILWGIYKYIPQHQLPVQENQTQNNPLPLPPPPQQEMAVDYASISDADVRVLFSELGKEYTISNLYSSHVLTVFNGKNKTEYIQYTVQYRTPGVSWSSQDKMTRPEHDQFVSDVQTYFKNKNYLVDREDPRESGDYINTRLYITKNQIACITDIGNFAGGSVLLCQRQVPNYDSLVNPITDSVQENNQLITGIAVRYISGNFARGTMSDMSGPGVWDWLAVKINGKWTKVAEAEWTCELVNKYKIPLEIYVACKK
jgi:hypothetical protein